MILTISIAVLVAALGVIGYAGAKMITDELDRLDQQDLDDDNY